MQSGNRGRGGRGRSVSSSMSSSSSSGGGGSGKRNRGRSRGGSKGSAGRGGGVSQGTQALMARMMEDSKLTPFQRRQLQASMKAGTSLPAKVDPTSSAPPAAAKRPGSLGLSVTGSREGSGGRKQSVDKLLHRKPLAAIVSSTDGYARPQYEAPQEVHDRDLERDQLADELAFGKDVAVAKRAIRERRAATRAQGSTAPASRGPASSAAKGGADVDLFDILVKEIEERQEHLQRLRHMRRDPQAEAVVRTEISQRIRQLEMLDRERSKSVSGKRT